MTDGLRGEILKVMVMTFKLWNLLIWNIPQNIMIRGYKRNKKSKLSKSYHDICREYHLQPTLERLLWDE